MVSRGTFNHFTWLTQGQRLSDKLEVCPSCEGVHLGLPPSAGDHLLPIEAPRMRENSSHLLCISKHVMVSDIWSTPPPPRPNPEARLAWVVPDHLISVGQSFCGALFVLPTLTSFRIKGMRTFSPRQTGCARPSLSSCLETVGR